MSINIYKDVKSKVRAIRVGVRNLIKWFPIVWRDRDYDQDYLYEMIHFKLSNMELFFKSKNTYSVEAPQIAEEIREAKDRLNSLINSVYSDKVESLPDEFFTIENHKWNANRDNSIYQEWKEAHRKAAELELDDMKEAFKLIAAKSQGWWD